MRRYFNNVISVIHSTIRFSLLKLLCGNHLHFSAIERFSPNVVLEIERGGAAHFGAMVRVHSGSKLKVRRGGKLDIGDHVSLNYNCIFVCYEEINVGSGTEFGPGVLIYDHDHDFRAGLKNALFKKKTVSIGENCWIGANVIILRGTKIGDNCVVGAGTIIRGGHYPANSLICEKKDIAIKTIAE